MTKTVSYVKDHRHRLATAMIRAFIRSGSRKLIVIPKQQSEKPFPHHLEAAQATLKKFFGIKSLNLIELVHLRDTLKEVLKNFSEQTSSGIKDEGSNDLIINNETAVRFVEKLYIPDLCTRVAEKLKLYRKCHGEIYDPKLFEELGQRYDPIFAILHGELFAGDYSGTEHYNAVKKLRQDTLDEIFTAREKSMLLEKD